VACGGLSLGVAKKARGIATGAVAGCKSNPGFAESENYRTNCDRAWLRRGRPGNMGGAWKEKIRRNPSPDSTNRKGSSPENAQPDRRLGNASQATEKGPQAAPQGQGSPGKKGGAK